MPSAPERPLTWIRRHRSIILPVIVDEEDKTDTADLAEVTGRLDEALSSTDRALDLADRTRATVAAHGWHGLVRAIGSVAEHLAEAREHLAAAEPPITSAAALLREISELLSSSEVAERFTAAAHELAHARTALHASVSLVEAALQQAVAAVIADLETSLHALGREINELVQGVEQCRERTEDEGRRAERFGSEAGASGGGLGLVEVTTRIQDLRRQGHGPQRHGARVTDQQLTDRALYRIDPMTGTTEDGVLPGQDHKCARVASRITTDAAYVHADRSIRSSSAYGEAISAARNNLQQRWQVRVPLKELFGPEYLRHVQGVRRHGSVNHPTGDPPGSLPPSPADLRDGFVVAIYKFGPDGSERLYTMYPDPKQAGE